MDLVYFLGLISGVQFCFILLLYERLLRMSKKMGELEGIRKGQFFAKKDDLFSKSSKWK